MPIPGDIQAAKIVRREITRRPIDYSRIDIRVNHGIVYIRGQVAAMRGQPLDIREEMQLIVKVIRQRPGIRDVILDVIYRT
ncbi:MAG: BON domain-containing protein [Armatimonadetes bacterium]|nr:BON domain-containing protein [Armatimonadota bacterium]